MDYSLKVTADSVQITQDDAKTKAVNESGWALKATATVNLTDNFEFLPLSLGSEKWANRISERMNETRNLKNAQKIYAAGYDIKDVSKFLQDTYIKLYNN